MIAAMRTTLDLDEDIVHAAKEIAAARGTTAGKVLSELALDGRTDADISAFAIDRPVLTMDNPPKSFTI